MVRIPSVRVG
ncbi:unnamed protein product, partial [Didymodactylos carnosus]